MISVFSSDFSEHDAETTGSARAQAERKIYSCAKEGMTSRFLVKINYFQAFLASSSSQKVPFTSLQFSSA